MKPNRFHVQRLSRSSIATWRTVFADDCRSRAEERFLMQSTAMRSGSVRLINAITEDVLKQATVNPAGRGSSSRCAPAA